MTYHTPSAPRLSGSILYTVISVFSLFLITACGGVSATLNITDGRTTLCNANPYAIACRDDETYDAKRKEVFDGCIADGTTDLCATVIPLVCDDNPFSALCAEIQEYLTERGNITTACEARTCTPTQFVHFCTDNPYHERCFEEAAYATIRAVILATCGTVADDGTSTEHRLCPAAEAVCDDNPFDTLCLVGDTYTTARAQTISTCIDPTGDLTSASCANAIKATCVGDGITDNSVLCDGAVSDEVVATCDSDIFNPICDDSPVYIGQRQANCELRPNEPRCAPVILNVCTYDAEDEDNTGNPFDALCQFGTTYETPRNEIITACALDLRGRLCTAATTFVCTDDPFNDLCYDGSATAFQTARRTAVTNCGDGTTTITEQICADAAQLACEGDGVDIFNALCGAYSGQAAQVAACGDNDDTTRCYRQEQIDACAEGTETSRCAQVGTGAISTCAADPFAAACVAGSTFAPYLSGAQGTRYTYCSADSRSGTDELCVSYRACQTALDASTDVPAGCGDNFSTTLRDGCVVTDAAFLFSTQCDGGRFDMQRSDFCATNENLFYVGCTTEYEDATARNTFCLTDPFHDGCKSNAAYADLREGLCTGDGVTPHDSCVTPALGTSPVAPTEPRLIPRDTSRRNPDPQNTDRYADSFLSVTITADGPRAPSFADIVRTVDVPESTDPGTGVVTPQHTIVEPTTIGFRTVGRRGGEGASDALNTNPDGYVFFTLLKAGTAAENLRTSIHAAILPTTNLGAPLTEAPATAVWPGHFSTTETSKETPADFYIDWDLKEIGFSNSAKTGIGYHAAANRAESRPGIIVANEIRLSINFNNAGQLYNSFAEIRDGGAAPGRLAVIGFIGQEGVVAAFVDRFNGGGAGGFTASNPDHSTYVPAFVEADANDAETDADGNSSLVNYEDWLDSGARPAAAPSAPSISEFLQTTTFTDNKRGFANLTNGANAQIGDFYSGTNFRSILLRGDAKNGFALHTTAGNHYSGVLHTADLGAPITQSEGSAIWRGYLSSRDSVTTQNAGGANVITTAVTHKLFELTVKFSTSHDGQAGELSGKVHRLTNVDGSGLLYNIEGRFNARGAISGSISRTEGLIEADLSGIIGQKGAIGVFVSNVAGNKFAGGFVAVPVPVRNANYATWLATHQGVGEPKVGGVYGLGAHPRASENHWLEGGFAGTAGGVNGQSRANIQPNSLNNGHNAGIIRLSDATWRRAALGGSAGNGVAFYSGIVGESGVRTYYSGLFAQTDLGRPLAAHGGRLNWAGRLDVLQGGPTGQSIVGRRSVGMVFHIDLNQTGGKITSTSLPSAITSPGYGYTINAIFNEDGFIIPGDKNSTVVARTGPYSTTGYLSGLIGQRGLVAAIVGGNMAGGIVATPNIPRFHTVKPTYDDWVHFAGQRHGRLVNVPHNESGRWNEFLLTEANAPYNISFGNSRSDDGARRRSYTVATTLGRDANNAPIHTPPGLTGGYSYLASLWNDNGCCNAEGPSKLQRTFHAGLHPNTSVGLPLPFGNYRPPGFTASDRTPVVATWRGHANIFGNKKFNYTSSATTVEQSATVRGGTEFRLSVNYSNRNFYTSGAIGGFLTINGYWDERGIMRGTVTNSLANYPDGVVTGLIGRQGAIGVFVSDEGHRNSTYGWTGGFIACPTIKANGSGRCAH